MKYYFYCPVDNTSHLITLDMGACVYCSDLILINGVFYEIGQKLHNAESLFNQDEMLGYVQAFTIFPKAKDELKPLSPC